MFEIILNKVLPINLIFILGYLLKRLKILDDGDGKIFFKIMFYALMPTVLFQSIRKTEFQMDFLIYPIVIMIYQILMFILGKFVVKNLVISKEKKIIIRGSLIIMNSGFIVPFFIAFNGMDEIWKVGLYDFGNSLIVFVLVYSMFFELKIAEFFKLLKSPPIVAIFLGLIFSILSLEIPFFLDTTLDQLGELVGPMIMLGLGLYFTPKFKYIKLTSKIVGIKAILGVGIGLFLMTILPFDELSNKTIVYLTASPVGANILTFAVLSKMDMELPAEIVSLSMIVNFILTPLLFLVL